jgi:hypothetical protein
MKEGAEFGCIVGVFTAAGNKAEFLRDLSFIFLAAHEWKM